MKACRNIFALNLMIIMGPFKTEMPYFFLVWSSLCIQLKYFVIIKVEINCDNIGRSYQNSGYIVSKLIIQNLLNRARHHLEMLQIIKKINDYKRKIC